MFRLTPSTPASASHLAVPPPPRRRTLLVGPPAKRLELAVSLPERVTHNLP